MYRLLIMIVFAALIGQKSEAQTWDQAQCNGGNCLQQGVMDGQSTPGLQGLASQVNNPAYQPCLENPAHPLCAGQVPGAFMPGSLSANPAQWANQARSGLRNSAVAWATQPASRALGADQAVYQGVQQQAQQLAAQQNLPCTGGQCWKNLLPTTVAPAKDRQNTLTALDMLQAMQTQRDPAGLAVFPGKYADCADTGTLVGSSKCCSGGTGALQSFWHQSCSAAEQQIQQAKNSGSASYLGSWSSCVRKSLGVCLRHEQHYAFCLWPGKLARLIQEQGHAQWGQALPWTCAGLTLSHPDQLALIDFNKLDLSSYIPASLSSTGTAAQVLP